MTIPAVTADPLAELAAIQERWSKVAYVVLKPEVVPEPGHQPSWLPDIPRLLAIPEALLKHHQPGVYVIYGDLCKCHENHRFFSITDAEAADVRACGDCEASATVFRACKGCGMQVDAERCPVRSLIAAALSGEEPT